MPFADEEVFSFLFFYVRLKYVFLRNIIIDCLVKKKSRDTKELCSEGGPRRLNTGIQFCPVT